MAKNKPGGRVLRLASDLAAAGQKGAKLKPKKKKRKQKKQQAVEVVDGAQQEQAHKRGPPQPNAQEEGAAGGQGGQQGRQGGGGGGGGAAAAAAAGDAGARGGRPGGSRLEVEAATATYLSEVIGHFGGLEDDEEKALLLGNVLEEIAGKEARVAADPVCSRHLEALLAIAQPAQLSAFLRSIMDGGGMLQLAVR